MERKRQNKIPGEKCRTSPRDSCAIEQGNRIGHIALRKKAEGDAAQRRRTPEERCEKEGSLVIDPQGEQGRKKGGARKKSTKSYRAFQPACKYSSQEEAEERTASWVPCSHEGESN